MSIDTSSDLFFFLFLALTAVAAAAVRLAPFLPQRLRVPASLAVLLVLLVLAPFTLDGFRTFQLTRIAVWAIVVMGLNILTGYNGQISLGHGALVAVGAYTAAILMDSTEQISFIDGSGWPDWAFWAPIIVAGGLTAILGLLLGIPALRLSGPYLAIATLTLVISLPSILRKYDGFTGGGAGIRLGRTQPPDFLDGVLDLDQWLYFLALFTAVVMLLLAWGILRGPLGRAFVAVRDSEVAAAAMGINVARTKVTAFTISAFYAGVAGGLFAQIMGTVTPESPGGIVTSINFLVAIVIGGLASIIGSVIGAAAIIFLPNDGPELVGQIPGLQTDIVERAPGAIQGLTVILVMLLMPFGVAGFAQRLTRLRPAAVMEGLRAVPAGLRSRAGATRGRLSSLWNARPWNRQTPSNPEDPDGGEGG